MMINEGVISINFSHLKSHPAYSYHHITHSMHMCVCVCVCVSSSSQCPIKQIISYRAFESIQLKENFLKINRTFH